MHTRGRAPKLCCFAQTSHKERIELSGAAICVGRKIADWVVTALRWTCRSNRPTWCSAGNFLFILISHRVPLDKIEFAFRLATNPGDFPDDELR